MSYFFRDINKRIDFFVVAFFFPLFNFASLTTQLNWQFLTACVPDKFAWLLFDIFGSASSFVEGFALLLKSVSQRIILRFTITF